LAETGNKITKQVSRQTMTLQAKGRYQQWRKRAMFT